MAVVGDAILSAVITSAIAKLTSVDMRSLFSRTQVEYELRKWKPRLLEIHAVLSDAEDKQITSLAVKRWLRKLLDLAYDVEDVLDEFETEALGRKLRRDSQASMSFTQKLLPACCIGLKPGALMQNMKMVSQLEEITTRLQEIVREKNDLDLGTSAGRRSNRVNSRATTSLLKEPHVYGRENDKHAIIQMMTGEASDSRFYVIPIIGIGGIGKTTLAQLVYNDETVKFECKAWVCVSDNFDISMITKSILLHWGSCESNDLNVLQERLKENLFGKKFLIVLDDVWSENYDDWTTLRSPFFAGAPGSMIIMTTRSGVVSSLMGSTQSYALKELSNDDCLSIFCQHALDVENFSAHPDLKVVGEDIVKRCKGLPLVAKTLGGLLRGKQNREDWHRILNSKIWDFPEEKSGILPALRLSYHHLPSSLKHCFAYCAILPRDYDFHAREVVLLWMAEGLLQHHDGKENMEDVGHKYFNELLARSFFQLSTGDKSKYVMHDLMHDLAQFVSGDICFNLDGKLNDVESYTKVRHSSFTPRYHDISGRLEVYHEMKNLRTFLALTTIPPAVCFLSSKVLHDLVPKFKCLRVLSLASYHLMELPSSIAALKLLRYLNLSYTQIERLPESLCELLNLQTLLLCWCAKLVDLPTCIGNLINLKFLDITHTNRLQKMPSQIASLTNLHILSKFTVGEAIDGLQIRDLMKFSQLRGRLHITGLQNVVNLRDAELANLTEKQGLDELVFEWTDDFQGMHKKLDEQQVLKSLRPHKNFQKLLIISYGGLTFPSWVEDPSFSKLVCIQLCNCHSSLSLPLLGRLPLLRDLSIKGMNGVKEVGDEFCCEASSTIMAFQSLETLVFEDMLEWQKWSWSDGLSREAGKILPKLSELTIINCPKFVGALPCYIPYLKKVRVVNCPRLAELPRFLPSLCELNVECCQAMILKSALDLSSLTNLRIKRMSGLVSLHETLQCTLVALEFLKIEDCDELTYLWQGGSDIDMLTSLKCLVVTNCLKLVALVEGEKELLPCSLEVLCVKECNNLEKLPNGLFRLSSLGDLIINKCSKLVSFPKGKLPTSLNCFNISRCENLECLPDGIVSNEGCYGTMPSHSALEYLTVQDISLSAFRLEECPPTLKELVIRSCKIRSLEPIHSLSALTRLEIVGCSSLECFPERGLPLPKLVSLGIVECENLRSLPNQMDNLAFLQSLFLWKCCRLMCFPEDGFPQNLISLRICYCTNLAQPMAEWGLHRLTSLKEMSIRGTCPSTDVLSFPDDAGLLLPISLEFLTIAGLDNLESLSKGIRNLISLSRLSISFCPKLRFLPKDGLPATLGCLGIKGCPPLKERCLKERGDYWPMIAHIPKVDLRDDLIRQTNLVFKFVHNLRRLGTN